MYKKIFFFFLIIIFLAGCASVPTKDSVNLHGISYAVLKPLCDARGIVLEYDAFSRTVTLSKNTHVVNLMLGDSLILADGNNVHLKYPVDIYDGNVVIPSNFKDQLLAIFGDSHTENNTAAIYKIKRIVVDAGHGGNDPGAIGRTGLREKDVNLDIAKRLAKLLKSQGIEVVLTRSTDKFITLPGRVDIANRGDIDLFISIHSNANRVKSMNGFEVYYVAPSVDDTKRATVAAKEAALNFDSKCFYNPTANLKTILWDMVYTDNRAESIELARSICRIMDRDLDAKNLGIKGGRYFVLKGPRVPAILIEIGFLSNANEERLLKNSFYRQQIAEDILRGIENYTQGLALAKARR